MAKIFREAENQFGVLKDKVVGVIGYGNQGRCQALNMRDMGLEVIIGTLKDDSWRTASEDGFNVYEVEQVVERSDVLLILVPDEVAPDLIQRKVLPYLKRRQVLSFASGYNVTFGFVNFPSFVDVILVAPRMIGVGIRRRFLAGKGFPVLVGVEQNASGIAWDYSLALAKGIGALQPGGCAVESSFYEETVVDLFSEHTWAGAILYILQACYEVLVEGGISPEVALIELYLSGELGEIGSSIAEVGLWDQLKFHSRTSQYGQLTRGSKYSTGKVKEMMRKSLEEIKDGSFAKEWKLEQIAGFPRFNGLWKKITSSAFYQQEREICQIFRCNVP